jgi:stage V sporulation protein S
VKTIRVSTRSRTASVAGAIAGVVREHGHAEVQSIGAGAVNQAIKAAAIATGYLAREGNEIICTPTFTEITIDGEQRTAVRLTVEPR